MPHSSCCLRRSHVVRPPGDYGGVFKLNYCNSILCLANSVFLIVYSIRSRRDKLLARNPGGPAEVENKVGQTEELQMTQQT